MKAQIRPTSRWASSLCALVLVSALSACGSSRSDGDFATVYAGQQGAGAVVDGGVAGAPADGVQVPATGTGTDAAPVPGAPATPGANAGANPGVNPGTTPGAAGPNAAPGKGGNAGTAGSASGGSKNNGASGGSQTGAAAAPARGAPIKLASVGTLSGPVGASLGGGVKGVQAWAAAVNAVGGVAGHPIELFVADDGGDPARYRSIIASMVEDKKVVAFVHTMAALSGASGVSYLESKKVPVLGSEGGSAWFLTSPMHFPQQPSDSFQAKSFAGMLAAAGKAAGLTKAGIIYCAEIQGCGSSTVAGPFNEAGLEVTYRTAASLALPDYTAQCINARNAKVQILLLGMDTQSVQRIADSCTSVGYKPQYAAVPQVVSGVLTTKSNLAGLWAPSTVAPWFDTGSPAIKEFLSATSRYAPGLDVGGSAMQGWVSAKLMQKAIETAKDPTTSDGILQSLWSMKNEDLGGLTLPLTFTKGAPNNAGSLKGCWWDIRITDGKFTSPNKGKRTC